MAINLPAFCDNQECGAIFPSGFVVDNAINIALSGNKSGPCPHCSGIGSIPDGVFNFVNNTIEIISAPQHTIDELGKLSRIIAEAIRNKESAKIIAGKIDREAPSFSRIGKNILAIGSSLLLFLSLINEIIEIKKNISPETNTTTHNITVNQVLNKIYQDNKVIINGDINYKIGRNDPCPCGAKNENNRPIKYKKCHGK